MSENLEPVLVDSLLCKTLTSIPEKFVVDFANGIDISRDHLRVQGNRDKFFTRLWDGFTGASAKRQRAINASLIDGLEGSLKWLGELSRELANSNLAIARVNDRVTQLNSHVMLLAEFSNETRLQLNSLAVELDDRILLLSEEVERIDFIQKARINLDQVFAKWTAGRFIGLSPAGNCYAAIEELRWGDFGDYCRANKGSERDNFLEQVIDRATIQLVSEAETSSLSRLSVYNTWLKQPALHKQNKDWTSALAYLADDFDPGEAPLITTVAQQLPEGQVGVPHIAKASRIAEAIVEEAFLQVA